MEKADSEDDKPLMMDGSFISGSYVRPFPSFLCWTDKNKTQKKHRSRPMESWDPSLALAVKRELCLDLFLLRDRSRLI